MQKLRPSMEHCPLYLPSLLAVSVGNASVYFLFGGLIESMYSTPSTSPSLTLSSLSSSSFFSSSCNAASMFATIASDALLPPTGVPYIDHRMLHRSSGGYEGSQLHAAEQQPLGLKRQHESVPTEWGSNTPDNIILAIVKLWQTDYSAAFDVARSLPFF